MTAQAPDELILNERVFSITAVDGSGLFQPSDFQLQPEPISTGCYRGFVVTYSIRDNHLAVTGLRLGAAEQPPALDGVAPEITEHGSEWIYDGIALAVDFTGHLLIGDGDVDRPYLNMGFWPAWMYADVYELRFAGGVLLDVTDRTAKSASVRERLGDTASHPAAGEPTTDWIHRTFSLTFAYNWPPTDPHSPGRSFA